MCPKCETHIRFYDNIPILSYVALGGKCRHCKAPISFRYPVIEFMSGIFAVGVFLKYGLTLEALVYYTFVAALLVITFIDIDRQIIPDVITLPGIPIFFAASFALSQITVVQSILGILIGGGSLFIPIFFAASFALSQITVVQSILGILIGGGSLFIFGRLVVSFADP
jgi:leader peptidase (prepilin peptidase)/N-methyltransferase